MAASPPSPEGAAPRIIDDAWVAKRLGRPAFRVEGGERGGIEGAVLAHANRQRAASYFARVPIPDAGRLTELLRCGFAPVSVGLRFARAPSAGIASPAVDVRPADPERDQRVGALAANADWVSRFHLDPSISDRVADAIKRDWALNSLSGGRGDGMLVAEVDGELAGFLAIIEAGGSAGPVREIDLMASAGWARGRGVATALTARFLADAASAGCREVGVGTQLANPRATRLYERLGFRIQEGWHDLHLHVSASTKGGRE